MMQEVYEIIGKKTDIINGKKINRGTLISITFRTVSDELQEE